MLLGPLSRLHPATTTLFSAINKTPFHRSIKTINSPVTFTPSGSPLGAMAERSPLTFCRSQSLGNLISLNHQLHFWFDKARCLRRLETRRLGHSALPLANLGPLVTSPSPWQLTLPHQAPTHPRHMCRCGCRDILGRTESYRQSKTQQIGRLGSLSLNAID